MIHWMDDEEARNEHREKLLEKIDEYAEEDEDPANLFRDCLTVLTQYEKWVAS